MRLNSSLVDLADIDHGLAVGKAFGEAPPDRQRQTSPLVVGQQRAETKIVEQYFAERRRLEIFDILADAITRSRMLRPIWLFRPAGS